MASDITLAVGDGSRRMTYAELAEARGISVPSARRLVRRHRWHRQTGNDGAVKIIVPLGHLRTDPGPSDGTSPGTPGKEAEIAPFSDPRLSDGTSARTTRTGPGTDAALSRAVELLGEQLALKDARIAALEAENAMLRRPWWRRMIGR